MTEEDLRALDGLGEDATHLEVERALREAGWEPCGAGDWAIALASPSRAWAARITPFDPAARYTAEVYRRGATCGWFPRLQRHRALEGGGALTVLEFLRAVAPEEAAALHRRFAARDPALADALLVLDEVDAIARRELPWWGPIDDNPANVLRAADGRLVLTDPFYPDGPALYAAVLAEPDRVVDAFPPDRRRYMLDLPLASSGPWDPELRERMRRALRSAEARQA